MQTRTRCVAVFAATFAIATGPAQAEKLATILLKEGTSAKVAAYAAECGLEGYHECVRADVGCSVPGDFTVSMFGYDGKAAGAMLAKDDAKGAITLGGRKIPLDAERLEFSDMDGDWGVTLRPHDGGTTVWKAGAKLGAITVSLGSKTVSFPQGAEDGKNVADLVKACSSGQ